MRRKIKDGVDFNSSKIISTRDIYLGADVTSSLEEHINKQDAEINQLKKWTKWYVKYGGMGSGGGGGTGGSGNLKTSCSVYFRDSSSSVEVVAAKTVYLWGNGKYTLSFNLTKTMGHAFTVKYDFGDKTISRVIPEGNSSTSVTVNLTKKCVFTFSVHDDSIDEDVIPTSYATIIPESFSVSPLLRYKDSKVDVSRVGSISYDYFVTNLEAKFGYTISEDINVYYKVRYKLEGDKEWTDLGDPGIFPKPTQANEITQGEEVVELDLSFVEKETSFGKKASIELIFGTNLDAATASSEGTYSLTIVPEGYYVLFGEVEGSENTLYSEEITEFSTVNKIKKGLLPFTVNLCSSSNESKVVKLSVYRKIDNSWVLATNEASSMLTTNKTYSISASYKLSVSESGIYKIVGSYGTYSTTKYFQIKESSNNWDYGQYGKVPGRSTTHYYHPTLYGEDISVTPHAKLPFMKMAQELYQDSLEIQIKQDSYGDSSNLFYDVNINIGIQYDSSNDDNKPFLKLSASSAEVLVYQNRITYKGEDLIGEYYFPKTVAASVDKTNQWHLLSINATFVKSSTDGRLGYYEFTVYVDGVLEGIASGTDDHGTTTAFNNDYKFTKFELNPEMCQIIKLRLLDISISAISPTQASFNLAESSLRGKYSFLYDNYATTYYNKFKSDLGFEEEEILDTLEFSTNILESFSFDEFGLPYTSNNYLGNIINALDTNGKKLLEVPIIVLSPDESTSNVVGEGNFFKKWFLAKWPETPTIPAQKPSTLTGYIYYVPADATSEGGLNDFRLNDASGSPVGFAFDIQGSSTRAFGIKNIELSIVQSDVSKTRIFTPNFDPNDKNSFLPEQSFTLKADIVDSSTCNNNSIGAFVNENTTPLDPNNCVARKTKFSKHIKNCLTGTPVLVFINVDNGTPDQKIYFAGIYNMNLGRKSYFNLGYYNKEAYESIENIMTDGLAGQMRFLDIEKPELVPTLTVTEISNGNEYFDFSQYHSTVLFSQATEGKEDDLSMFSADDSLFSNENASKAILSNAVKQISLAGGYIFETLGKNMIPAGDTKVLPYLLHKNGVSLNCVTDYKKQYTRREYTSEYTEIPGKGATGTADNLIDCVGNQREEGSVTPFIDLRALVEYYVICMAFGMTDSVLKNLELKSWGDGNYTDPDNIKPATIYPAFYDMDTALGVDNNGKSVNYFAFSDYWSNNEEEISTGIMKSNGVNIYPDFYLKGDTGSGEKAKTGYDIPSSYLFALAKYATMEKIGVQGNLPKISGTEAVTEDSVDMSPVNIYSLYRKGGYATEEEGGDLQSASYFIRKYFNRLSHIPNSLKNLNYRSKYAKINYWGIPEFNNSEIMDQTSTASTTINVSHLSDIGKFKGTGLAKKEAWLTSRLRLLDAYFNINSGVNYELKYASYTGNVTPDGKTDKVQDVQWNYMYTDSGGYYSYPKKTTGVTFGSDVSITEQIFYTPDGTKSDLSVNTFYVKAPSYTPVVITQAGQSSKAFLIGDDTKKTTYSIPINTVGNQAWGIYGSKEFSYISNLGLVQLNDSRITSDNLEDITYIPSPEISGNHSNFTINTPNISSIVFNGSDTDPKYTGKLTISESSVDGSVTYQYSKLTKISLSKSKIYCDCSLSSLPVATLEIDKMNIPDAGVSFPNLTMLSTVKMDGSSFRTLSLPIWKQTVKISGNDPNQQTDYDFHNVSIVDLTLNNSAKSIAGAKVYLHSLTDLSKVTINDVEELYIYDCPKLEKVDVGTKVKILYISNCSKSVSSFTIGSKTNEIDLTNCENLTSLYLYNTGNFTRVNIGSNKVTLTGSNFTACKTLQYLDNYVKGKPLGEYILQGGSIFYQCDDLTLRCSEDVVAEGETFPNILVSNNSGWNGNISYAFQARSSGNIDFEAANYFFTNNYNKGRHPYVKNITRLFCNQPHIGDNWGWNSYFTSLRFYTSITTATEAFLYSKITHWTKELFNFGASGLSMSGCFYTSDSEGYVHATVDFLSNIGSKLTSFSDINEVGSSQSYKIYSTGKALLSDIKMKDILQYLTNITSIRAFGRIYQGQNNTIKIDLKDCFSKCSKLSGIYQFLWSNSTWYNLVYQSEVEGEEIVTSCLQCLSNLATIGGCLNLSSIVPGHTSVDLLNILSSSQWSNVGGLFNWALGSFGSTLSCRKHITIDDYKTLLGYLAANTKITTIPGIFKNCDITDCGSETPLLVIPYSGDNTAVTSLHQTFYSVRAWYGAVDSSTRIPVSIEGPEGDTIFSYLPKVTQAYYLYYNNWIEGYIPFDFFKQRGEVVRRNSGIYFPVITFPTPKDQIVTDTTNYEYIYYTSQTYLRESGGPSRPEGVSDRVSASSQPEGVPIFKDDATNRWTTKAPILSTYTPNDSSSMNLRTNTTRKEVWRCRRTKPKTKDEDYGEFGNVELLERFESPIEIETQYTLYNRRSVKVSDIRGIFGECRWTIPYFRYTNDWYLQEDLRSYIRNKAKPSETFTFFYTSQDCSKTTIDTTYRLATEIDDLEVGRTIENVDRPERVEVNGVVFSNFKLIHDTIQGGNESTITYPFVSPDFFLGLSSSLFMDHAFYSSHTNAYSWGEFTGSTKFAQQLEGYIPAHLLSKITTYNSITNWICNCNILPVKYGNTNCYSFTPQNFIPVSLSTFNGVLNFHIRVPRYSASEIESNKAYYVMYTNSLKSSSSNTPGFNGAFPVYATRGWRGESIVPTSDASGPYDVTSGNYNFNYHLLLDPSSGGVEGTLDSYDSFKNGRYDGMISTDLVYVLCGRIWSDNTGLNKVKTNGSYVFAGYVSWANSLKGINRNLILPKTTTVFNKAIFNGTPWRIAHSTVNDSEAAWNSTYGSGQITYVN